MAQYIATTKVAVYIVTIAVDALLAVHGHMLLATVLDIENQHLVDPMLSQFLVHHVVQLEAAYTQVLEVTTIESLQLFTLL